MKNKYEQLVAHSKRARLFESIEALLHWDQETYMPKKGIVVRGEQLELIASLHHKAKTDKEFGKLLDELIDLESGEIKADLPFVQEVSLKRWRRDYLLAKALPNSFVQEFAKLNSEAISVWTEARKKDDFSLFAPYLQKTIAMCRQKAAYIDSSKEVYDLLLDLHEPEMTAKELVSYFTPLKKALIELLAQCERVDNSFLHGDFPKEQQVAFGNLLLDKLGYDLEKGRLDLSTHPFSTSLHPYDSRVTTRIHKSALFDSLSAVLHEAGHSLYEMGFNEKAFGTPLCEAVSYAIHESQSRLYETFVGQGKAFWQSLYPTLQEHFKEQLTKVSLEQFYRGINRVSPSLIRVEADEVTYNFHVMLRFEIEKALLEESLKVAELPAAWNAKMKEYLGVEVPNNREGCLQDIHWAMGGFGYFPTYTLGNLYAGQFFDAFCKAHPDWESRFANGEFLFIKEWLGKEVHCHGRLYTASELVKRVSGAPLSIAPYLSYLTKKYRLRSNHSSFE